MGNSQSSSQVNEPAVEKLLIQQLRDLRARDSVSQREIEHEYIQVESEKGIPHSFSTDPSLDIKTATEWEKELLASPKNRLALNALLSNNIRDIVSNKVSTLQDTQTFNIKIPFEGSPVTNQRSSGRCWLFATTNVLRVPLMKKYNLKEFELSQSYLFFWDKMEKANWFLEQAIDTADQDLDERVVQELLGAPVNDGGQWDMASNLVEKYGLVRMFFSTLMLLSCYYGFTDSA
jgi:bleomycin hydrolase